MVWIQSKNRVSQRKKLPSPSDSAEYSGKYRWYFVEMQKEDMVVKRGLLFSTRTCYVLWRIEEMIKAEERSRLSGNWKFYQSTTHHRFACAIIESIKL